MSWSSIKDKSVPMSKRNLASLVLAGHKVLTLPGHAPYLMQIGLQSFASSTLLALLGKASSYQYKQLAEEQEKLHQHQVTKEQLRAMIRAFAVALDDL